MASADDAPRQKDNGSEESEQDSLVQKEVSKIGRDGGPGICPEESLSRRKIIAVISEKIDFLWFDGSVARLTVILEVAQQGFHVCQSF